MAEALTREVVAAKLKNLLDDEAPATELQVRYQEAASVLSFFSMNEIRPVGGADHQEQPAIKFLLPVSETVYDERHHPQWALRSEVRKEVLRRLASEKRLQEALNANPNRSQDTLQVLLESYFNQSAPDLEEQNVNELLCTLQISDWLQGALEGIPAPDQVRREVEIKNLLSPFRFLVGSHFRGREHELNVLSDYVEVHTASTLLKSIARGIRNILSLTEKPPLLIYGPGGMGKSTLVAKFVLDHVAIDKSRRFPFAYLDFDRPSLLAGEPITLLLEAVRQLEAQYPDASESLRKLHEVWSRRMQDPNQIILPAERYQQHPSFRLKNRETFLDEFANAVKSLMGTDQPFLLVLDTFEEVQYQSQTYVEEIFSFLNDLQARIPKLRAVLAGRAPINVENFKTQDLPLESFDSEAAQGFLAAHGVTDPEVAALLAQQFGGNPLTLKLVAELIEKEESGRDLVRDLQAQKELSKKIESEVVQGFLYKRILDHIHDPEVSKLAHPGMVLRRVSPELILEVLAGPCDVKVEDLDAARDLFAKLSREVSLVAWHEEGVLLHRQDLRGIMLASLHASEPDKVKRIHQQAVKFYSRYEDNVSRAEELYHRLSLGVDRKKLNERWRDDVQPYLVNAVDELPPESQAFLAARTGTEVRAEVWESADIEDWELYIKKRAGELLSLGQPAHALKALRQREGRTPGSALHALEIDALIRLNRQNEAREVLKRAMLSVGRADPGSTRLDLEVLSAKLDEQKGVTQSPSELLKRFRNMLSLYGNDIKLVTLGMSYMRQSAGTDVEKEIRTHIASILKGLPENVLARNQRLLEEFADLDASHFSSRRPNVFVSSPFEDIQVAEAIRDHLKDTARVSIWPLSSPNAIVDIESFSADLSRYDYAVMVLPSLEANPGETPHKSAYRDNVLFEAGLLIGALGRDRVFLFRPEEKPSPLADLEQKLGVSALTYMPGFKDLWDHVTESALRKLEFSIKELGLKASAREATKEEQFEQAARYFEDLLVQRYGVKAVSTSLTVDIQDLEGTAKFSRQWQGIKVSRDVQLAQIPGKVWAGTPNSKILQHPVLVKKGNFPKSVYLKQRVTNDTRSEFDIVIAGALTHIDPNLDLQYESLVSKFCLMTKEEADEAYEGSDFTHEYVALELEILTDRATLEVIFPVGYSAEMHPGVFFGQSESTHSSELQRVRAGFELTPRGARFIIDKPMLGFSYLIYWLPPPRKVVDNIRPTL